MTLRKFLFYLFLIFPLALLTVALLLTFWMSLFVLGPVVLMILFFIKVRRQRMVLVLIQHALQTGTPLHEVMESYAQSCTGPWYREKVLRFSEHLRSGHSLDVAAMACRGVLRYDAVGLIRLGGDSQQIASLLRQTVNDVRRNSNLQLQSLMRLTWFCGYVPALTFLPLWSLFWLIPKFEAIFKDFDTELPSGTVLFIWLSDWFIRYWYLLGPELCVLVLLPFMYFMSRAAILPWRPWGTRRILRLIDSAYFLRLLAAGLEMQKSIPDIVTPYALAVNSGYLRNTARNFGMQVESGKNWIAALTDIRWLTKGEAALLEAATRLENVPQMLREIAAGKEQQQISADNAAGRSVFLVFVLGIGAFVGLFAAAFFLPLVQLIKSMT